MPTFDDLSDTFKSAYRAWLALEQQLFLSKGSIDHPDVLAARAVFEPLWDALTEHEKYLVRNWPCEEKNYPEKLRA